MNTRTHLNSELIAKISGSIEAMPPKPASRKELELLLAGIEAQVHAAQERGCTYADIAKQITENGYPIKTSTLRIAMQHRRKKKPNASRTAREKQTPSPSTGAATNVTPPVKGTQTP
jgi:hypothetical protein